MPARGSRDADRPVGRAPGAPGARRRLATGALGPTDPLVAGARGSGAQVVVEDFGRAAVPDRFSYDGQAVYVTARGLPDLRAARDHGIAEYRIRRILLPLLAWPAPSGPWTVAALVVANAVGLGLAAFGLSDLAQRHGARPEVGYAAVVALAFPFVVTTTEALAFGLGFAGAARVSAGGVALGLAALVPGVRSAPRVPVQVEPH